MVPKEALRGAFFFFGGGCGRQGSFAAVLVRVSEVGMHGVSLDGCYWLERRVFLILNYCIVVRSDEKLGLMS